MKNWYSNWHNKDHHPYVHWGSLVVLGVLATGYVLFQIGLYVKEEVNISLITLKFQTDTAQAAGPHDYFNALVARPDHWKSYSLRDTTQLGYKNQGGYSDTNSYSFPNTLYVTYNPASDQDVHAQDAAKVVIPPFIQAEDSHTLSSSINSTQLSFQLTDIPKASIFWNGGTGRRIKIDDEIMEITSLPNDATNTMTVAARGVEGTIATSHAAGAAVLYNTNSLSTQVHLPLETSDGNTYFFTWDAYWTDSYLNSGLTNHKAFQFASDGVWFEPQTGFDGARKSRFSQTTDVAVVTARTYNILGGGSDWSATDGNHAGPGVLTDNYITPRLSMPTIAPNRWSRFWVRIEQRANDYDYVSMWFADESQDAVLIYDNLPVSVRPESGNTIENFWLEFNTSTDRYTRGNGQRDFVSYVKNFVALRNPGDVTGLLQRPVSGGVPPPPTPDTTAPTIYISSPANNATVSGTTTLSAVASDNIGVAGVQFKLDGANLGTEDTTVPYSISWNTTQTANGSHTLTAVARDAAGNTKVSTALSVTVNNSTTTPPPPPAPQPPPPLVPPPPAPSQSPTPNPVPTPSPSPTQVPPPSPNPPPVTVSLPVDGTIIKDSDQPAIYIMEFGKKRPFATWDAFVGLGYLGKPIQTMNTSAIPLGTGIFTKDQRHPRGTLVLINGTVYFLGSELKYGFPSLEVFNSWGRDLSEIVPGNPHDSAITNGPVAGIKK